MTEVGKITEWFVADFILTRNYGFKICLDKEKKCDRCFSTDDWSYELPCEDIICKNCIDCFLNKEDGLVCPSCEKIIKSRVQIKSDLIR